MQRLLICAIAGLLGPQPMRVVVNIPAYRVDAYVDDSLVRSMPIAVGMTRFRTPRGSFAITSIDWNPWWIPPDRPWAAKEKRTPPGPANPMGRVKLNFQPLLFLHGSPARGSIGSAASHGCIRMLNEDAIALARLVHRYGTPALTADDVDRLAADITRSHLVELDAPVPIEIRYDLVEIRAEHVVVYRDIYGLATRPLADEVYSVLAGRGIDAALVDSAAVRALTRRVAPAGNSIPIDSVMLVVPGAGRREAGAGQPLVESLRNLGRFPTDPGGMRLHNWVNTDQESEWFEAESCWERVPCVLRCPV